MDTYVKSVPRATQDQTALKVNSSNGDIHTYNQALITKNKWFISHFAIVSVSLSGTYKCYSIIQILLITPKIGKSYAKAQFHPS